jgi:hypothetical protein
VKRALTLLAALALGTLPLSAGATTAPPLTLTQQAKKADVIVRATLGPATSVKEGEVTWTVYPLTVTETVAGDAASLPQQDGKPALYLLSGTEGLPELRAGQEAFLLLYSRKLDSPVVGFTQGFYPIENGRVTRPGTGAGVAASTAPASPGTPAATATPPTSTPTTPAATTATPAPTTQTPATLTPAAPTPAAPATPATGSATAPATPATTTSPAAATATPPTTTPTPTDPDPIETDPAKFRDALRAARGAQ